MGTLASSTPLTAGVMDPHGGTGHKSTASENWKLATKLNIGSFGANFKTTRTGLPDR